MISYLNMPFFSVFFKTLGFLLGITSFIIILNILLYFAPEKIENFEFDKGDKESDNIIATLDLNGPILNNLNKNYISNIIEYIDPERVKNYLFRLEELKPKILIIKINSPGGTVAASSSLEKIISNFKNKNNVKIYFFTNEVLASGGYWVATSGDKIYANYGSIIGSIGVSGPSWYFYNNPKSISSGIFGEKIETENGIEVFDQNAGNSKDLYNPFRKPTNKELIHLQNIVKEIYDDFLSKVSKSRKIEISTLRNDIGALIFNSNQAKKNFLIDDIIDFDELIKKIVKNNNLNDYKIIKLKTNLSFTERYFTNYLNLDNSFICNKLKTSFVTFMPIFLNKC